MGRDSQCDRISGWPAKYKLADVWWNIGLVGVERMLGLQTEQANCQGTIVREAAEAAVRMEVQCVADPVPPSPTAVCMLAWREGTLTGDVTVDDTSPATQRALPVCAISHSKWTPSKLRRAGPKNDRSARRRICNSCAQGSPHWT